MAGELAVTVVRTGGIAGIAREWSASGPAADWLPLVDACPWRAVPADDASRDRFVYVITVTAPRTRRTARVPEAALTGPWRELVDRVRSAGTPTPPRPQ
jgi:hypothetical protein